jgi:PPE-repeat protein
MTVPFPPIWIAAPPEVHSTLLNFGGTPVGMVIAGASWTDLGAQYTAAITELEAILAQVQAGYQGPSATQFVGAHQPMLAWLTDASIKAALAATAHSEIVAGYEGAVVAMPTLGELMENHTVHGVLIGTNFFGVNTIPIALNEADYIRMWVLAADVISGWDAISTAAADSIPLTPASPAILVPGVGETGSAAATTASFRTVGEGQAAGTALNGADLMGTKLLVGKTATSPASAADGAAPTQVGNAVTGIEDATDDAGQSALQPENMAGSFLQQGASMGPSAAQSAASALQGAGPQQLLSSAPQMLSSAPQTLGQMLTNFTGQGLGPSTSAMPVGFAGTGALRGINPAGVTSLAGGAFGSGPSRPLLPSTWGASATTAAAESMPNTGRGLTPVTAGIPASGASGTGGAMMGAGAHNRRGGHSQEVTAYADDAVEDEDAEARGRSP